MFFLFYRLNFAFVDRTKVGPDYERNSNFHGIGEIFAVVLSLPGFDAVLRGCRSVQERSQRVGPGTELEYEEERIGTSRRRRGWAVNGWRNGTKWSG